MRRLCGVMKETVQAMVKETGRAISLHRAAAGDDDHGQQQPCACHKTVRRRGVTTEGVYVQLALP